MLEAFVYIFAVYGLLCLAYFNLKEKLGTLRTRTAAAGQSEEVCLVVKVKNAEENIEGLVRELVKLGWKLGLPHRLIISSAGSQDQTGEILERLVLRYPNLGIDAQPEAGGRKVVVELSSQLHPRQAAELLKRAFKQEIST